jgi:predicted nuclease with TOPRIM domain
MESQAFRRLQADLDRLLDEHQRSRSRSEQLAAALAKSRDELERLKGETHRYKLERTETRKRLDRLIRRFDSLGVTDRDAGTEVEA